MAILTSVTLAAAPGRVHLVLWVARHLLLLLLLQRLSRAGNLGPARHVVSCPMVSLTPHSPLCAVESDPEPEDFEDLLHATIYAKRRSEGPDTRTSSFVII